MTHENGRPEANRTAESISRRDGHSVNDTDLDPASGTLIGASVEQQLDRALWQLVRGDIELRDLTPALAGFYIIGHGDGYAAGFDTTNEWLRFDRDRWYFVANNPGKKPGDYFGHLTSRLWDEASR